MQRAHFCVLFARVERVIRRLSIDRKLSLTARQSVTDTEGNMRTSAVLVFLLSALTVIAGLHYYLWLRLIRDPHWPAPWPSLATTVLILAALSIPATLVLLRVSPYVVRLMAWPAFVWIGLMFLGVVVLAGADVLRLAIFLGRRAMNSSPFEPERRLFFARCLSTGALVAAGGLGIAGMRSALSAVKVHRIEIPLRRLTSRHDGITLVQLTDLHIGPTIRKRDLADIVHRTNSLLPDLVAITGDLVDGTVAELRDAVSPLAELRAKHGVFFVTGNHEYFSGAASWVEEISRLGIRVLRNERVVIGGAEAGFDLAGVDDRSAARSSEEGHGEDLAKALGGRDPKRAVILLAHQPRTVLDAAKFGVDLQLSGHTHGGQIWPFGALVRLQQRFLAGLGRHGDTTIYVSRGTGYWGPPMRLFAPAEITQIVLRSLA
jgi:predicted MPP superfamily phosphohydrolase